MNRISGGVLRTAHGEVSLPAFFPDATRAAVRSLSSWGSWPRKSDVGSHMGGSHMGPIETRVEATSRHDL